MFLRTKDNSREKAHNTSLFLILAHILPVSDFIAEFSFSKKIIAAARHGNVYFHRMRFARLRLSRFAHQINVNIEQSMSIAWIDIMAVL